MSYARGAARERMVMRELEAEGWDCTRSAGSHSPKDVVACRRGQIRFIQVKADQRGPFAHFGPQDRKELLAAAARAGAVAEVCWWPPRGGPRWIRPDGWPPDKS